MPEATDVTPPASALAPPAQVAPSLQPVAVVPGRTLGIVGFALSCIALTSLVGLVLSAIAFVKSRRAGATNGFALAGIIIASVGIGFMLIVLALLLPVVADAMQTCAQLGDGVHQSDSATYTCTPTSSSVSRRA